MTQHRSTARASSVAARRDRSTGSSVRGLVSLGAGAASVVVAILPALGIVALLLAGLAIAAGVQIMRQGPDAPAFRFARTGVVLGMIGVLLGFVSLAMQLLD